MLGGAEWDSPETGSVRGERAKSGVEDSPGDTPPGNTSLVLLLLRLGV